MKNFSKSVGSTMHHDDAKKEIGRYKESVKDHKHALHSALFGRDVIDEILKDENCHGIIMELATGDDGVQKIIIHGVDSNVAKLSSPANASITCPPFCGSAPSHPQNP